MSHVGEGLSRLLYYTSDSSHQPSSGPPFARSRILPPDGRSLLLAWVGAALKVLKENHLSSLAAPGSPRARLLRKPSYTPTKGPCGPRDLTTQGREVPEVPGSSG